MAARAGEVSKNERGANVAQAPGYAAETQRGEQGPHQRATCSAHQARQVASSGAPPKLVSVMAAVPAGGFSQTASRPSWMTMPVWCSVRYHGAPGSSAASAAAPGAAAGGGQVQRPARLAAAALDREAQLVGERDPALGDVVVAVGRRARVIRRRVSTPRSSSAMRSPSCDAVAPLEHVAAVVDPRLLEEDHVDLVAEALVVPAEPARDQRGLAQVAPDLVGLGGEGELGDDHGS